MNLKKTLLLGLTFGSCLFATAAHHVTASEKSGKTESVASQSEWTEAKKAGFSYDQFKSIMAIPTLKNETPQSQKMSRATSDQERVVQVAKQQIGIPYVWGGTDPSTGFDCSGLVQYVYKKAVNMNLPRVTTDQQNMGSAVPVSKSQLQKGDLLFYGYPNSYHVAIYAGDGYLIQAPKPGETVQMVNMDYFVPNHARRVLKASNTNNSSNGSNNSGSNNSTNSGNNTSTSPTATAEDTYQTVVKKGITIYKNTSLTKKDGDTTPYYNQTIHTKRYYTINGSKYYSAYNNDDLWIGYIREDALSKANNQGGLYHKVNNGYATISKANYNFYRNFNFAKNGNNTSQLMNNTYKVKGYYNHFNGERYYTLYDNNDQWLGYVNNDATKDTDANGNYYKVGQYVSLGTSGTLYGDKGMTKAKTDIADHHQEATVYAKGGYTRFDGTVLRSLYDSHDQWLGYATDKQVTVAKNQGGVYHKYDKYATIESNNTPIYRNFNFDVKGNTRDYYRQTLHVKGYYQAYDGNRYYTVYDKQDEWVGYVNEDAVTLATKDGANYAVHRDVQLKTEHRKYFYSDRALTKTKSLASNFDNQTLTIKYIYPTFDQGNIASVYDDRDQWVGYLPEDEFVYLNDAYRK